MILLANLSGDAPANETAAIGMSVGPGQTIHEDLSHYECFTIEATLTGGAGGTMQVGLQTSYDGGATWLDYLRFPDIATGAAATTYKCSPSLTNDIVPVGKSATAFTLAVNKCAGGHPGDRMRVLFVPQTGVTTAVTQTIKLFGAAAAAHR